MRQLAARPAPDLSAGTAQATFCSFMPGCLASLVLALAFGTTKSLRDRLRSALVPRCLLAARPSSSGAARRQQQRQSHRRRSGEFRYVAMDTDNGILSRQRRLSMEKQLRIEVTYEFEIRNEQVEPAPVLQLRGARDWEQQQGGGGGGGGGLLGKSKKTGGSAFPYSVESHRWDDTERILPKKPSISLMRGQG